MIFSPEDGREPNFSFWVNRVKIIPPLNIWLDGDEILENGVVKGYLNNKKTAEDKWSLLTEIHPIKQHSFFGKVIHIGREDGKTEVARINPDSSITFVAQIDKDGKRTDRPKDKQHTFKKFHTDQELGLPPEPDPDTGKKKGFDGRQPKGGGPDVENPNRPKKKE